MFHEVVAYIMETRTSADMLKYFERIDNAEESEAVLSPYKGKWISVIGAESCLEFLDYFFTYCVEWSAYGKFVLL